MPNAILLIDTQSVAMESRRCGLRRRVRTVQADVVQPVGTWPDVLAGTIDPVTSH